MPRSHSLPVDDAAAIESDFLLRVTHRIEEARVFVDPCRDRRIKGRPRRVTGPEADCQDLIRRLALAEGSFSESLMERLPPGRRLLWEVGGGGFLRRRPEFAVFAAVSPRRSQVIGLASALLDLYENSGLPRDIRLRLISPDPAVYRAAVSVLIDAFKALTAEHKLPTNFRGWKVLGAKEGCPVRDARAFVAGPGGSVLILADGLVRHDGTHWQVTPPSAIRVHKPVHAVWTDRQGRTWVGSAAASSRAKKA